MTCVTTSGVEPPATGPFPAHPRACRNRASSTRQKSCGLPSTNVTGIRSPNASISSGEAVMSIEELDSVASAALNRFGGTAREAVDVTA